MAKEKEWLYYRNISCMGKKKKIKLNCCSRSTIISVMLYLPGVVQNMKGYNCVGSKMMAKIQAEG